MSYGVGNVLGVTFNTVGISVVTVKLVAGANSWSNLQATLSANFVLGAEQGAPVSGGRWTRILALISWPRTPLCS